MSLRKARRFPNTRRGYTVVELMMAISVFAIGVSGTIAMQKVTLGSNRHAKNLTVATHIGQAWVEQLQTDAIVWNFPSAANPGAASDLDDTLWLEEVESNGNWFRPVWDDDRVFGPGFDALGNPTSVVDDMVYCTHVRLNWLNPDDQGVVGNGMIRAEVRVFWLREGQGGRVNSEALCSSQTNAALIGAEPNLYHFVYNTTAVRQNSGTR